MSGQDGDPDEDLVRSLLHRSDGPVVLRPLRGPVSLRRTPLAAVIAAGLVVVVVAGLAGLALNARQRNAAALPSPSSMAVQGSPVGANLAPQAGRGFVVNLGGHGVGIRTEADAAPYFQVISSTLLSYAVSPDGKLAYWQTGTDDALPHALHVYDPASRTDRTVLTLTDERGGSGGFMVWSTDGGGLAIGTSDVGSALEGQRAPSRPKVATWSLLDLASGSRRKVATISDAWVMPVSWNRQTDIATATEYGRDGPSTPTRLFYVWNPQRAVGKATQFVLPAAIEPFTARADSEAKYVVAIESLQCAPSLCQSVWMWPATDPTAASARRIAGHTVGAPAFRPGTTDLFARIGPLCCTTPAPSERPTIVELGPPGASTLRTVYTYSAGDSNFFFRSDGGAIIVNNGDLNNRRGITVVDPATGTTILLPVDRDGVRDVIASIGPGISPPATSPSPNVPLIWQEGLVADAQRVQAQLAFWPLVSSYAPVDVRVQVQTRDGCGISTSPCLDYRFESLTGTLVLQVLQGPAGCCLDAARPGAVRNIDIRPGVQAKYDPVSPQFGGPILWWVEDTARGPVYAAINSPVFSEDELIRIANSMRPLP
jgi:hypothetical protein